MNCFYCGLLLKRGSAETTPNYATKDHQDPKVSGGSLGPFNVVWACGKCNQEKGRLTVDEYRAVWAYRKGLLWGAEKRHTFWGEQSLLNAAHAYYGLRAREIWIRLKRVVLPKKYRKEKRVPRSSANPMRKIATLGEIVMARGSRSVKGARC